MAANQFCTTLPEGQPRRERSSEPTREAKRKSRHEGFESEGSYDDEEGFTPAQSRAKRSQDESQSFQAQEGINVRSQVADEAPRGQARTAERLGHHKVSKYNLAYVLKQTQDVMLFIQQKIAAYNFEREMPTLEGAGMPQRYM